MSGFRLTTEAASRLADLPNLQELTRKDTDIRDEVLTARRRNPSLNRFDWTGSSVPGNSLAAWKAVNPVLILIPAIAKNTVSRPVASSPAVSRP